MERIVTLRFVSKESGLSLMRSGIKSREWGFLAEHRHKIDDMFTSIVFDDEKVDGIKILGYKNLIAGIKEVTFKFEENFDIVDKFLSDYIDSALKKVANQNFKAMVVAYRVGLNYGFGLRAKVIKYRVSYTSKNDFMNVVKEYFRGVSTKKMEEILSKAEKIYAEKVEKAKRLKTLNHIKKTRESYKRALQEIREKARKKFGKKANVAWLIFIS